MDHVEVTIIGAGAVGLAVARQLGALGCSLAVLERHNGFGQETSSRNSEVIHAGIYYPAGSEKARLCVEGAELLYAYCARRGVAHRRIGKMIVAVEPGELAGLEALRQTGEGNGVQGLRLLSRKEAQALEPEVRCQAALFSPNTGIFNTHQYMEALAAEAQDRGALLVYGAEVASVESEGAGYRIGFQQGNEPFITRVVVNCAGLASDAVAAAAGVRDPAYRLHWCKGDYFRLDRPLPVRHLVYPVVSGQAHGLGIHLTQDLAGRARFGPDVAYVEALDYAVDASKQGLFAQAVRRYLPGVPPEALMPDTSGIRPKLQGPQDGFRDFIIRHEADRGFPGLINLVGIESPGLTASLAIARKVQGLVEEALAK
jgi:L-2-hydroxyglutarate oxidase LhgO